MAEPFFTIGHSTRPIGDLVGLLQESAVSLIVDVRTVPRSRTNPQFNRDTLPTSLGDYGIGYEHIAELGGLRGKRRDTTPSPNTFWDNNSFRNYADHAMGEAFQRGFARLRELGAERRCAIMCAEAVWWRCHRRIITDYLLAAGENVVHILGPGHAEAAKPTPSAVIQPDGTILYPAAQGRLPIEA